MLDHPTHQRLRDLKLDGMAFGGLTRPHQGPRSPAHLSPNSRAKPMPRRSLMPNGSAC